MSVVVGLHVHRNGNFHVITEKHITLFSLFLGMRRSLKAQVKADVKVYLIPKDQLVFGEDGKPKLDDKWLVYQSKKKKGA